MFETNTLGWRTLRRFKRLPLPWMDHLDGDGKPELIVWNSFRIGDGAGLMAWVYRIDDDGIAIDWSLTRGFAGELAAAYREPLKVERPRLRRLRKRAARALEKFANGKCAVASERSR